ncbi:subtilisin-like protease SBT3.11 [Ziziphus jujuba]|uniref:Subtilisin-like protease SBT3.11 n=1 Tax=Ziziphus jujuba TaxID=326968 RepID=A0A6P4B412_ZIZJJ|nr:subtilisin-like protease SBT3.11 [Ziziphus jujuba]
MVLYQGGRRRSSVSVCLVLISIVWIGMADSSPKLGVEGDSSSSTTPAAVSESAVHIIYTEQPPNNEEPESFHIRTLASVFGSEDAAKEALIYSYKNAASGFSAKLTPQQVLEISKQPGVLQVVPSRTLQLHSGPAKLH